MERNSLKVVEAPPSKPDGLCTSMSFNSFLLNTELPLWYPLKHVYTNRAKVLSMFHLKPKHDGVSATVRYNPNHGHLTAPISSTCRKQFRVAIVGAGLSGLGCAQELLRLSKVTNVPLEVVMIEARDRIGGRCCTDRTTFKTPNGNDFPVDLGACWIHGATDNPLVQLARSSGLQMSIASENIKLLVDKMREADEKSDAKIAKLFDDLLDDGAQKCFARDEFDCSQREQMATRYYAQVLEEGAAKFGCRSDVAAHRYSSDSSVYVSIKKDMVRNCAAMPRDELNLLSWNIKHTEYSFGANIQDLSMKYWDFVNTPSKDHI